MRSLVALYFVLIPAVTFAQDLRTEAAAGLKKAVTFFHDHVASAGGYVYKVSADLKLREGEGKTSTSTIFVQPPGTPAVGLALVEAYQRTGEQYLLDDAIDAGRALVKGQMVSGGWSQAVYFETETRKKYAYRVDGPPAKKAKNISSFDDDQTQSALRFLMALDAALKFKDAEIHGSATTALSAVLAAQHLNGAWSQVFDGPVPQDGPADLKASIPAEWSRKYPGGDYWWHYTFNDGAMARTIDMLLTAATTYKEPRYRDAAIRGGEFILRAQLPDPQPAWAQQYDKAMHPAWARKFEPPAVASAETQTILLTLIRVHRETGDAKWLKPIPSAIEWLKKSMLEDGQLARFYELGTNKPLYMTSDYKITYDDGDAPSHYGWKLKSKVPKISDELDRARKGEKPSTRKPSADEVRKILAAMDGRGAWVEQGPLKYHKVDGPIIDSQTFIDHVDVLSRYLAK
jgi:hypothetical protein